MVGLGGEPASWGHNAEFSCILTWQEREGSSAGLFYEGTNTIHEAPPSGPNYFQISSSHYVITSGVQTSTCKFYGNIIMRP